MSIAKPSRAAAILGGILSVAIVAGAGALAWRGHQHSQGNPLSDDASVEAEVVRIASGVPGRVKAVHVEENALVKAGDVLVELDDSAYRLALAQTRADLEIAQALASDRARNIEAERANAEIAAEQVERARANLELATRTVERLQPMQAKGYVSVQQLDDARTVQRDAEASLREALRQQEAAEALVGDDAGAEALIRARRAAVAVAEYELAQTTLRAPADGRVVGLSAAEGDFVLPAQSMFSLIKTAVWHVSAGYTETELPRISAGDCATVYVLADRSRKIAGVVDGVGWGVSSRDLVNLPVALPIVPKSLDWVRVQQRFPVRIRLIDPPADLMRAGASAVSIVHHDRKC